MRVLRRSAFLLIACLVFLHSSVKLLGQTAYDLVYDFSVDTVRIQGIQTFNNQLMVKNRSDSDLEVFPDPDVVFPGKTLIGLPDVITVGAQQTRYFPLKFLADRSSISQQNEQFSVRLVGEAGLSIQPEATFSVHLNQERSLLMGSDQAEYYIDPATRQAPVMVRVANRGLAPLDFRIELVSAQEGLALNGEALPIQLQAGQQELIPFSVALTSRAQRADGLVVLRARDADGHVLATLRIRVMTVDSIQQFGAGRLPGDQALNNEFALRYLSMNHYQSIFQIEGNGQLDFQKGRTLDYRLNLDYYSDFKAMNVYNTYLDYQEPTWGVKVGNIYENLDYAINGRGIKASYKIDDQRAVHLYGVDNNYMLVNQIIDPIPGAKIIGAAYAFGEYLRHPGRVSYLHTRDAYRGIRSHQISGVSPLRKTESQSLDVEAGYSTEQTEAGHTKQAISLGLRFDYRVGDYLFAGNSYYSSPYYTGLRRGVFQTDARVIRSLAPGRNVSARLSVLDNNPKYQEGERVHYLTSRRRVQIYELGYREQVGLFALDVRPYLMRQGLDIPEHFFNRFSGESWYADAIRTVVDWSYFQPHHRFSLKTDYGWVYRYRGNVHSSPYHSLRMNGFYQYGLLGFQGYLQINPYYLSDVLSSVQHKDNYLYSFGPNSQFQFFDDRLDVYLSGMYNYYGFSGTRNFSVQSQVNWDLGNHWRLSGSLYYSLMRSRAPYVHAQATDVAFYQFYNRQIRVGIEKQFSGMQTGRGHRLDLLFFDDVNQNGLHDRGEPTLAGVVARIDGQVARSDGRGRVRFSGMKPGSYQVLTEASDGWSALGTVDVVMSKNYRLEVPMVKTSALSGRIVRANQRYLASSASLGGISIVAEAENGRAFKTLSDGEGRFSFYLPPGKFTVRIDSEGMPFQIVNGVQRVEIMAGENQSLGDFEYIDQRRKVDVKRF
ncbi:MAG TPA: hypothetical protein H9825_04425 [Candidatus Sphingobacterium stercorigallinarum]|nr:hypothetical protein [Candidatus Sphingobacterium stercorigallinarum]